MQEFYVVHVLTNIWYCRVGLFVLVLVILGTLKYSSMALICICPLTIDVEHMAMNFLAFAYSFVVKCLFMHFPQSFKIGLFVFLLLFVGVLKNIFW